MPYPAVAGQGLYDTSTTAKHTLGAVKAFKNSDGTVTMARYASNAAGATLAAGKVVYWAGAEGEIGGVVAASASANAPAVVGGGLAASCASAGGYAWVIFRGKQTNASASATLASASNDRALNYQTGVLATAAGTYATNNAAQNYVCAHLKAGQALAAAASNTVYWTWR